MKRGTGHGFTLVELMIASAILVTFLIAYLGTYHSLLKSAQQSKGFSLAFASCLNKMNEIFAHNFSSVVADYSATGTPGNTFDITGFDPTSGLIGKGNVHIVMGVGGGGGDGEWVQATSAAAWGGRYSHTSLVYDSGSGNEMWVIGGIEGSIRKNDVWSSTDGKNWTLKTSAAAWPARDEHTSLVYLDRMWVIGGQSYHQGAGYGDPSYPIFYNDVWSSANGINWTLETSAAAWGGRYSHTSLVYDSGSGNKMWVIGGMEGSNQKNDVWSSTNGINWTLETSSAAWSARGSSTSLVYDSGSGNEMWVIGGWFNSDVWSSADGKNWTLATSAIPNAWLHEHTSVVYNNKMWVLDGWLSQTTWDSTDGVNWTQATSSVPWTGRYNSAALDYNNKMWVMGGQWGSEYRNDVWYYSEGGVGGGVPVGPPYEIKISASFQTPDGRLIGEDTNLNGTLDEGEDANSNGELDSPVQVRMLVSEKKKEIIFLGRPQ